MQYILIQTDDNRTLYQEIAHGFLQRSCDLDGNTVPPLTVSHWVIDANPVQPSWALPDPPIPVPPPSMIISKLEFRNKFTTEEKISIYTAADANIIIKIWLDDLSNSEYVDLQSEQIQQGVQFLASAGLITETRADEILNA